MSMLGKLMVNTDEEGNSLCEQLNELVVIETNEVVCNDEPYYPARVKRSHMEDIALAVNSHQAMKEALEAVVQWDDLSLIDDEWPVVMSQVKQALALTNTKGDSTECV